MKKHHVKYLVLFVGILCLLLSGCQSSQLSDVEHISAKQTEPPVTPEPMPEKNEENTEALLAYYKKAVVQPDAEVVFSAKSGFYKADVVLTLSAEGSADIFYSDDGGEPGTGSIRYEHPISMSATEADLPRCAVIRAVAYYPDGTKSPVCTQVYFLNTKIKNRFKLPVISIVGSPDELTDGPTALLVGQRALDTGVYARRTVLLQMYSKNGSEIINQDATLRVYGGNSRTMPIKSLELIADIEEEIIEAETDTAAEQASFSYAFFDTVNAEGESVQQYQRLILSNSEDDFQYAFIRDELAQTIARKAGFPDTEGVTPAVVYINGEYYGLSWLHEAYCNDYFQEKYGAADGRYAVIEWRGEDENPVQALEEADQSAAQAFQSAMTKLIAMDFQDEYHFERLRERIDVENYLDYCALNIYINNENWPAQTLAYAFIPSGGDAEGAQWRFLPHGMDHSFGLKAGENGADHDTLEAVLNPESPRYAPLFAKLMEREDCRAYFIQKMTALMETAFEPEAALSVLNTLHSARNDEMNYYFTRLDTLKKMRNSPIWVKKSNYDSAMKELKNYIKTRPAAMREALERNLTRDGSLLSYDGVHYVQ